jgi:hypothetical protein
VAALVACALVIVPARSRIGHVEEVSRLASPGPAAPDAGSPTGYAGGGRLLILPGRGEASFHWIMETQQMLAGGGARVRSTPAENAPDGREVTTPSPYRWWLGGLARLDHAVSGRPLGLCAERAALDADTILLVAAILIGSALAAWRLGALPACVVAVGLATAYPFAAGFAPGMPDPRGLSSLCAFGSVALVLLGISPGRRGSAPWFAASGVLGGLGTWLSVQTQFPVTAGIAAGGALAVWLGRQGPGRDELPWRSWAGAGAVSVLAAYAAEYFPGEMGTLRLGAVHPVYGVAWIGLGELARQAGLAPERARVRRERVLLALGAGAALALPAAMASVRAWGFLGKDLVWARLGGLPEAPAAASTWAWIARDGASPEVIGTLAVLVVVLPAAWLLLSGRAYGPSGTRLAVAIGPVVAALGFAVRELSWWPVADAAALALLLALAADADWTAKGVRGSWIVSAATVVLAAAGLPRLLPSGPQGPQAALSPAESEELVDRHLAQWLARRSGTPGLVVYAPPGQTTLLEYYGGLRGIGTFAPENRAGFSAALSIAGARDLGDLEAQVDSRGIRYLVVPSWDPFFRDFARLYLAPEQAGRQSLFAGDLPRLELPAWLRPVPYQLPVGGGYEGQSALVLEVVDPQPPAVLEGRIDEFLVETGDTARARAREERLRRFPGDVGALAAMAQVESAAGDGDALRGTLESLQSRLSAGGDRYLAWDRRVSLAIVLARAERVEACRAQVGRCLEGVSEERLRTLTAGSLYGLLVLSRTFGLEIRDPSLRALALDLLPEDVRSRL